MSGEVPLKVRTCLRCGSSVEVLGDWSRRCSGCGFEWREMWAGGGEDLAYRTRRDVRGVAWTVVPRGCLGVFGGS